MKIVQNDRGFVAATVDVEAEDKSDAVRRRACQLLATWQPHGSGGNHVMPSVDGKSVRQVGTARGVSGYNPWRFD
jgi:hypothetical protein